MTITNPPQHLTVTEGNDAVFQCRADENGTAISTDWRFTPSGSLAAVPLVTGTSLSGIERVTVSSGLRTMLTLSRVHREANGGTVVCVAVGSTLVMSNPATLTVQCELCINVHTQLFTFLSKGI